MAGTAFQLEVITPDTSVLTAEVTSLRVPTGEGSIGILARHAPLVSTVGEGVLEAEGTDGTRHVIHVGDGFVEVSGQDVRVLTDVGEDSAAIDVDRARRAETRARERLGRRSDPEVDAARAEAALRRAMMRLQTVERRGL